MKIKETITIENARALLEMNKKQRVNDCVKEIEAVLEKHRCAMTGVPFIRGDGTIGGEVRIEAV